MTGRNNIDKSIYPQEINQFHLPTTAKEKIPVECYSNQDESKIIQLIDQFIVDSWTDETVTILKEYSNDNRKYYDAQDPEIKHAYELKETLDEILANNPFYITSYMTTEEIDKQVQQIYLQII
ncbi:hypothetical protein OCD79_03925 [Bacillus wiedmannii]|uniref:hypothetical protein n=1 Tax=Bacillus wiedmannii TaxID=1890302 RepID=UPI0021CF5298|nr:hypothetical protein [Bacillus wiedmannii]MCU5110828.1 hypothetical protein [Bacillus wiedmannii]MCU5150420.1 hypothetical protein [Bacillus wiedmannii]MCU5410776.1 hypothetical protein [Bacillus wiedmannii]